MKQERNSGAEQYPVTNGFRRNSIAFAVNILLEEDHLRTPKMLISCQQSLRIDTRGKRLVKRTRRKEDQDEVETAAKILINLSSTSFEDSTVSNPTYTDVEVQTDPTPESVEFRRQVQLKVTIQQLQSKLLSLEGTLFTLSQKQKMMTFIVDNNEKTKFPTGLPSYALFCSLFDYMQPVIERARKYQLTLKYLCLEGQGN